MALVGSTHGEEEGTLVVVLPPADAAGIAIGAVGAVRTVGSHCEVLCREEGKCLETGRVS